MEGGREGDQAGGGGGGVAALIKCITNHCSSKCQQRRWAALMDAFLAEITRNFKLRDQIKTRANFLSELHGTVFIFLEEEGWWNSGSQTELEDTERGREKKPSFRGEGLSVVCAHTVD